MKFGICLLNIIPVRKDPDDRSEMVSQILFGELLKIIKSKDNWLNISLNLDNYEGWIDKKQIIFISEPEFNRLSTDPFTISNEIISIVKLPNNSIVPIVFGSQLYFDASKNENNFQVQTKTYQFLSPRKTSLDHAPITCLRKYAAMFLNAPYLWGGRTPFGIDCSGFTQILFKSIGKILPRNAIQQYHSIPTEISSGNPQTGDLAFFSKQNNTISHVGIVLESNQIMHASGKVRLDLLDEKGIFNQDIKEYTHKLVSIKRPDLH